MAPCVPFCPSPPSDYLPGQPPHHGLIHRGTSTTRAALAGGATGTGQSDWGWGAGGIHLDVPPSPHPRGPLEPRAVKAAWGEEAGE